MKKTLFVQPRHIYAPPPAEGRGHIYSPTSLWTVGSKLIQAGADIEFADENLHPADTGKADVVGVNLVGAPYIPVVRERFRDVIENEQELLVGGQVITGLTREQLSKLFGNKAIGGSLIESARATGANYENLHTDQQTSLIPAYERMSDEYMKEYLDPQREISFYLSQGCIQNCHFCPAQRGEKEEYRSMEVIEQDLGYLTEKSKQFGFNELNMYLSNLDVFQTPEKVREFTSVVSALKKKNPGFSYNIRGLGITTSVTKMRRDAREIMDEFVRLGFHTIGLGVDGGDNETRRLQRKGFVTDENVWESMEVCREFGIQPESIMVFGGQQETRKSLENALRLTEGLLEEFGSVPRPHVFKDMIPGNKYWDGSEPSVRAAERRGTLLNHPEYFQAMDFKALPSSLSHPDAKQRRLVKECYLKQLQLCPDEADRNSYILSRDPELTDEENRRVSTENIGRYDR